MCFFVHSQPVRTSGSTTLVSTLEKFADYAVSIQSITLYSQDGEN